MSLENKKYIVYLLKYLGVALIAGSVVHVGTLDNGTTRYIILGIIGLVLMVVGNILEAKQNGDQINFKYLMIITGLSLATGFFSGGIQHYFDNPVYAGYLLAIGLLCSYIIFFLRDKIQLYVRNIAIVTCVSVAIIVVSLSLPVQMSSGHHSTVSEETVISTSSPAQHEDLPGTPVHGH